MMMEKMERIHIHSSHINISRMGKESIVGKKHLINDPHIIENYIIANIEIGKKLRSYRIKGIDSRNYVRRSLETMNCILNDPITSRNRIFTRKNLMGDHGTKVTAPQRVTEKVIALQTHQEDGVFVDFACGTGTFLETEIQQLWKLSLIANLDTRAKCILERIIGFDIDQLQIQETKANLVEFFKHLGVPVQPKDIQVFCLDSLNPNNYPFMKKQIMKTKPTHVSFFGNPPYHRMINNETNLFDAAPIYPLFHGLEKLIPDGIPLSITYIIPLRPFYGAGKLAAKRFGLKVLCSGKVTQFVRLRPGSFENEMDRDNGPRDGHGIYRWERDRTPGPMEVIIENSNGSFIECSHDPLLDGFIPQNLDTEGHAIAFIRKIREFVSKGVEYMTPRSSQFYGIRTTYWDKHIEDTGPDTALCTTTAGTGKRTLKKISISKIKNPNTVMEWKVVTPCANGGNHRGDKGLGTVKILPPGVICSETDMIMEFSDTKEEAVNCANILKSPVVQYLISTRKITQNLPSVVKNLIPRLDYHRIWTNDDLFNLFGFSQEQRNHILKETRPIIERLSKQGGPEGNLMIDLDVNSSHQDEFIKAYYQGI